MEAAEGRLLVVTGPPGAGKSTVASLLADRRASSVLVEGDAFFRFVRQGFVEPWLEESAQQNTVTVAAAAKAAGRFAAGGYMTVYDGVVGPWFLDHFLDESGLNLLDYVVLMPPVELCLDRVRTRIGHGFTDEDATRKMHADFENAGGASSHIIHEPLESAEAVAELIEKRLAANTLIYPRQQATSA